MHTLNTLFKNIPTVEPDQMLESRIFHSITLEMRRRARRKILAVYACVDGSFVALVFVVFSYSRIVIDSDFWNLIQLLFSDATVITSHWGSFAFSLLEAFPAFAIALLLAPVFTSLLSFMMYCKAIDRNNRYHYA
jgi:hypothetical protein